MNQTLMDQASARLDEAIAKEATLVHITACGSKRQARMASQEVATLLDEAVALEAEALTAQPSRIAA